MRISQKSLNEITVAMFLSLPILSGCSAGDQVIPYESNTTINDSEFYAYGGSSSLTAGGYTYIYAQGGITPYTYSVVSGSASVNASGYLQVFEVGEVLVRVQDASGNGTVLQFDVEGETTTGSPCLYLGTRTQQTSGSTEARVDLTAHTMLAKHLITGVGVRFDGDALAGIYAKTTKFNADATLSTSEAFNYITGKLGGTAKGEIYIGLPTGYYLTGVGIAAYTTDKGVTNAEALKLFGAKVTSTGTQDGTIECLVDKDQSFCTSSTNSMSSKAYFSRYQEYRSTYNKPIVAWGLTLDKSKVISTYIATKTISSSTTDTGLCPE